MDAIELTYTLADVYAVTFQSWRRLVVRVFLLFGFLIAVLLALPMIMDGSSLQASVGWFPWDFYLGLIAFLLCFLFGAAPAISYFRSKRQGFLGPNVLRLSADGVEHESPKGRTIVYWSAITRFVATRSRLFLFIGPTNALLLPKRAFADESTFAVAVDKARILLETAKSGG